jgi:translation initiation factor 2 beta subunit (eIF-2beta)/eIF-5
MDPFYRYKIVEPCLKFVRNHTIIENFKKISKSLEREPFIVCKFLSYSLCTHVTLKENECKLNGVHSKEKIEKSLEKFKKDFIDCKACGNPETYISRGRKKIIKNLCKACGHASELPDHKLTKIIRNMSPYAENINKMRTY